MFGTRREMTSGDTDYAVENTKTPRGAFLGSIMREQFLVGSSPGVATIEAQIGGEEVEEFGRRGRDVATEQKIEGFEGPLRAAPHMRGPDPTFMPEGKKELKTLSKDDWENSQYFREGIEYSDDMTITRARITAEEFDDAKYRQSLITGRHAGALDNVLGFGVGMVASLPDPINFLPIGRAVKGVGAMAKVGGAVLEGAVGNVAVSAVTRPYWEKRGVESDWQDYVLDATLGAALGGAFGGLGAFADNIRGKTKAKQAETLGRGMEAIIAGEDPNSIDGFADTVNEIRRQNGDDPIEFVAEQEAPGIEQLEIATAEDPDGLVSHVTDEELQNLETLRDEGLLTEGELVRLDEANRVSDAANKAEEAYNLAVECII